MNISDLSAWCGIDFDGIYSNPLYQYNVYLVLDGNIISDLVIPDDVEEIKRLAFHGYTHLKSVKFSTSVKTIGKEAFQGCKYLASITIPKTVTKIEWAAFALCERLRSIAVDPENVIYDSRDNCNAIIETTSNTLILGCKTTIIPNSVTSIGSYAFVGCSGLTEIYCKATNPPTCNTKYQTFSDETLQYVTLYVPTGCKSAYESVDPWRNFWNIEEYEFSGVESTLVDDVNVSVENGNVVIGGAENANVEVYNVNGQCVYSGNATTIPVTAKGLYIVKVNNKSFKVIL